MASYIKSGMMAKYLMKSPKRIVTDRMKELEEYASNLDEIVDDMRIIPGRDKTYGRAPLTDQMREMRDKASKAWKEYEDIDSVVNAEYHAFWNDGTP
jgi:hypothetical protein